MVVPVVDIVDRPRQFIGFGVVKEVLVPASEDILNKVPVSQRVNSSRTPGDDPILIEAIKLEAA